MTFEELRNFVQNEMHNIDDDNEIMVKDSRTGAMFNLESISVEYPKYKGKGDNKPGTVWFNFEEF